MKKRKKPIFLVAVLALLFVTVAAINSSSLASKKDPADAQVEANAQQATAATQQSNTAQKAAAQPVGSGPLAAADPDDAPDQFQNVKPIPAIPEDGPKILAPKNLKNITKDPDHAGTRANSGWYMNGGR